MRKVKKQVDKHKISTDRYLITYADLLTLLLGLFAILYSASQVDLSKYSEISSALVNVFNKNTDRDAVDLVAPNTHLVGLPTPVIVPSDKNRSIVSVKKEIENELKNFLDDKKIAVENTTGGLKIILNAGLIFSSASADINVAGLQIIDTLSTVLKKINKQINVDGHTDAIPMRSMRYESNWHLAMARAVSVGYLLISRGVPEHNIVLRSFGGQRPIHDNTTEEGRAYNRRVEIIITDKDDNVPTVVEPSEEIKD